MARALPLNIKELDAFERTLGLLRKEARTVAKRALYAGAAVAADALRESVDSLQCVPDVDAINAWRAGTPTLLSVSQKNGLREGLGITPIKTKNGSTSVRIGFDGYNNVKTKRWLNGQPNQMVAAQCEHGHSKILLEQPFIRPVREQQEAAIIRAMVREGTETVTNIINSWV